MEDKFDDDHYVILGLPSGEEGAKLSEKEITKAYRKRALEIHPDKRPDHRNAHADIQRLNASYAILKDEKARKSFDDLVRVRDAKLRIRRQSSQQGSKRRKMVNDLEERERASEAKAREEEEEEEKIHRKFKEEVARIRAKQGNRVGPIGIGLEKEKVIKVSWKKIGGGEDYSAERLRELFGKFGEVEDVVIKSLKKRGSAVVVMASKDAVAAAATTAAGSVFGNLSNPLWVFPLQPISTSVPGAQRSDLVGDAHQVFEDLVLKKLQKVIAQMEPLGGGATNLVVQQ
ncbi:hypothetical protein ACSBR1_032053 [Camellia fascicularis]